MFTRVKEYFNLFKGHGSGRRYYPKPTTNALIVHPDDIEGRILYGLHNGFKVCMEALYIGCYIEDDE